MKTRFMKILAAALSVTAVCACRSGAKAVTPDSSEQPQYTEAVKSEPSVVRGKGGMASYLPKAVIYRTDGDYNDLVPVTVTPGGPGLQSYPDPSDVGEFSRPVPVADGWLLDRRGGIGPYTRFTKWTYAEYHTLPQVPSVQEIIRNILPEARVTQAWRLTVPFNPVDTAAVNRLIREGLPGCTRIM